MRTTVKVIIPIYKTTLNQWENAALANNMHQLATHPIVFLKPGWLNINPITQLYPQSTVMEVSDNWIGTRRGIAGYN